MMQTQCQLFSDNRIRVSKGQKRSKGLGNIQKVNNQTGFQCKYNFTNTRNITCKDQVKKKKKK